MRFLILIVFLFASASDAADKTLKDCVIALENAGLAKIEEGTIEQAKDEIAGLLIEKSKLTGSSDIPLLKLVERNVNRKMDEFKKRFGEDVNPEEIKKLIRQKENEGQAKDVEDHAREKSIRKKERDASLIYPFEFKTVKEALIPTSLLKNLHDVDVFFDRNKGMKLFYNTGDEWQPGTHFLDVVTGQDIHLGKDLSSVKYYEGQNEEALVFVSRISSGSSDEAIKILDLKTGNVQSIPVRDLTRGLTHWMGQGKIKAMPWEKPSGEMGVIFTWEQGWEKPVAVYSLDPKTKETKELEMVDYDHRMYRSSDNKQIYISSFSGLNGGTKTLRVWDQINGKKLLEEKLPFKDSSDAFNFNTEKLILYESKNGKPYIGANLYESDKIIIYDLLGNKAKTFPKSSNDSGKLTPNSQAAHAESRGVFAESNDGRFVFLPRKKTESNLQTVIDIDASKTTTISLGNTTSSTLSSIVNVAPQGLVAFYYGPDQMTLDKLPPQQWGSFRRNLVALPLLLGHAFIEDINDMGLERLLTTYVEKDGRVMGVFRNRGWQPDQGRPANLTLMQLSGPSGGSQ